MFGVVDAVLLQPFPYRDPDRLVFLWGSKSLTQKPGVGLDLALWRETSVTFDDADGFVAGMRASLGPEAADTVPAACVGRRILPMLGVEPLRGVALTGDRFDPEGSAVVVLSHALWRTRFGGNDGIIGQEIRIDGRPHTVAAVMPERFFFPDVDVRLWLLSPCGLAESEMHGLGRLAPGVSLAQAQAELDSAHAHQTHATARVRRQPGVFRLHDVVVSDVDRALWTMLAAVGVVLLLACANAAHLQLSRGIGRRAELAMRAAAGASRTRLMRQMLTESALLAVAATIVGLLATAGGLRLVRAANLTDIPRLDAVALDRRILVVAIAACVLTTLASGLWPAWKVSRPGTADALRCSGGATPSRRRQGRDLLTVIQVSLATALVIVTGLAVRSFVEISRADWGFDSAGMLLVEVRPPGDLLQPAAAGEWRRLVLDRVRRLPGVVAASHGTGVPLRWNAWWPMPVSIDGRPSNIVAGVWTVGSGYFAAAGMTVVRGRDFTDADDESAPRRIVVSRAFAEQAWPGTDPMNHQLQLLELRPDARERFERDPASFRNRLEATLLQPVEEASWEVIGLVDNVRTFGLQVGSNPGVYIVEAQVPQSMRPATAVTQFIVRANERDRGVAAAVRSAILAVDTRAEFADIVWLDDVITESVGGRGSNRLMLLVSVTFGALALMLAATGVYSLVSLDVQDRLEEFAIRAAVGAGSGDIARAAFAPVARLVAGGLALGMTIAWAATRGMGALLYGITPGDPSSYAAAGATLAAAASLACVAPLKRALASDPVSMLKA